MKSYNITINGISITIKAENLSEALEKAYDSFVQVMPEEQTPYDKWLEAAGLI